MNVDALTGTPPAGQVLLRKWNGMKGVESRRTRRPTAPSAELRQGREAYGHSAWGEAYRAFTQADKASPLAADDLELLAWAAGLTGHDDELLATLERLHRAKLEAGDPVRAARAAFWLAFRLLSLGEVGRATGWLGRADRLVEQAGRPCVEKGYLLLPAGNRCLVSGDCEAAFAVGVEALAIAERFSDADLAALARSVQGRARILKGRVREGLVLLDEAIAPATLGELSPLVTGLVYCTVIAWCQRVYALDRAQEWTSALEAWCKGQPDLVTFTGACLVHRAEILELHGLWQAAGAEAQRAVQRPSRSEDQAAAWYQRAEIHRLRGEFAEAENAYRQASKFGREPQPGLSLLRMAQGRRDAAVSAIRATVGATSDRLGRVRLLPALVEILLSCGEVEEASVASGELDAFATTFESEVLSAIASHARGAVLLARGDAQSALEPLRYAFSVWQRVEAPYLAARIRLLIGKACGALGDTEGGRLELDAARAVFEELGAVSDLGRTDVPATGDRTSDARGLTARELQVLALVATGKTNKAIARELFLSEKTVDRHLSNIFTKLDVSSRAAATSYAHVHRLI